MIRIFSVTMKFTSFAHTSWRHIFNKKVLLRKGKRHTARGVSSTPSVTWGGVPPWPGLMGGTRGGVPPAGVPAGEVWWGVPEVGYPPAGLPPPLARSDRGLPKVGYPPQGYPLPGLMGGTWGGVPPSRGTPSPPGWTWLGSPPPQLDLVRILPPQVWTDKQSETITSHLVLRTQSVIKITVSV